MLAALDDCDGDTLRALLVQLESLEEAVGDEVDAGLIVAGDEPAPLPDDVTIELSGESAPTSTRSARPFWRCPVNGASTRSSW